MILCHLVLGVDPAAACSDRGWTLILLTLARITTEIIETSVALLVDFRCFVCHRRRRSPVIFIINLVLIRGLLLLLLLVLLLGRWSYRRLLSLSVRRCQQRTILVTWSWLVDMRIVMNHGVGRLLEELFGGQQRRHKVVRLCVDILHVHTKVRSCRWWPAICFSLTASSVVDVFGLRLLAVTHIATADELFWLRLHRLLVKLLLVTLTLMLRWVLVRM